MSESLDQKLTRFGTFEEGWAHGEGDAFDPHTIAAARAVANIYACNNVDAFPARDGTVIISVYLPEGQIEIDVRFEPSDEVQS